MSLSEADRFFLAQCETVKKESHDPDRQVGVVIVGTDGRVLATGSNKPPEAMKFSVSESHHAIAHDPKWKYFMLEHAERNAINKARELCNSISGATMYGTLFPCADCARAIAAGGIRRLVVPISTIKFPRDEKWRDHFDYARKILVLSGVELTLVLPENLEEPDKESQSI